MKIEKEMTIDSHIRDKKGYEKDHNRTKVKKEDSKENGLQRQLSEEEYEREKAEIAVQVIDGDVVDK